VLSSRTSHFGPRAAAIIISFARYCAVVVKTEEKRGGFLPNPPILCGFHSRVVQPWRPEPLSRLFRYANVDGLPIWRDRSGTTLGGGYMGRGLLLWLLGIPIPVIILLYLFHVI
jgi:hypothetical protein